mgnify:CR=1 FL=1
MREMIDSGIPCIGEVAKEFQILRLKNVAEILDQFRKPITADQRNQDSDILYDYYGASGVIDKIDGYTIDDHVMLIGEDGANLRMRNLPLMYEVNGKAWINNHAHILKPKDTILFRYLFLTLEGLDINPYITGSAQPKLNQENLRNIWLPVPPIDVQQAIVDSLDCEYAKVDALIANVQTQIEKLKAYKQSVITEAVTKGLDPTVPMKDSGVEWIGEIPEKWNTIRVKQLLKERKERSVDGSEEPLSMSQKLGLVPTRMMDMVPNMASSFVGAKLAYIDDLVFNKLKAHLGVFSVSKYDGLVSPDYAVYYSTGKVHLKYLEYLFKTPQCISEFCKRSTGIAAGLTRLYTDGLFAIECPFPDMDEQVAIVDYLNEKCSHIDQLMAIKQEKIEKLEQCKHSLIYEYATGKKEVPAQN